MNNRTVTVEKLINAPIEKVWLALTDKDQMRQWYFDLSDFRAEEGFEFSFPGQGAKGEKYIHLCRVTAVIPFRKLQYSWQYEGFDGFSLVTFDLQEEEAGTLVTVTHTGLESFPQNNPDFATGSFTAGWTELITRLLPGFLEKN